MTLFDGPEQRGSGDEGRGWRGRAFTVVRVAFVLLAVGLGVHGVARDLDGFRDALVMIGPLRASGAAVLVVAGLIVSAEVWRLAIRSIAGPLTGGAARGYYFVTQLGKYIPGGVWTIAAQVEMAKRHGLRGGHVGVASLLFLGYHLATGVAVAGATLPVAIPGVLTDHAWAIAVVVLAVVGLSPPVVRLAVTWTLRIVRQPALSRPLRLADVASPIAWMLVVWMAFGAATFLVAQPLLRDGSLGGLLVASVGGFALAWAAGVVVVLAPAGVGVREVVFVFVFAPMLGVTAATSVAITLRVVHTAADLGLAGVTRWRARHLLASHPEA